MATQNSIDHISNPLASTAVTIDPGAAGDSYVQFDINTTGKFRIGVDDDAADAFKISQGSALGGATDTFVMTADGERTMPLQVAFSFYTNAGAANVTGDATAYTLVFDTEVFDQNGDFDGTSTFTSPVDGRYWLIGFCEFSGLLATHTSCYLWISTSKRTYYQNRNSPWKMSDVGAVSSVISTAFADMDAADTSTVTLRVSNGTKVVDVVGGAVYTAFQGYLSC